MRGVLHRQLYFQLVGDCENGRDARGADVAQQEEHGLPKLGGAALKPVARSIFLWDLKGDETDVSMTLSPPKITELGYD